LAVDCIIPTGKIPTHTKLITDAKIKLRELRDNILNDTVPNIERNPIIVDISACDFVKKQRVLQDFSQMNKEWSVSKSSTIKERLEKDKSEWYYYHKLYREKRGNWVEIPYIEISKQIKREDWIVGDFGCGENLFSKEITNKVYSFDYVAIDENVIACDISHVPIENEILDVAVFSLSLMGSNKEDYIKEANRTLKLSGFIYIAEPFKKWEKKENELIMLLENNGFECLPLKTSSDKKFIYLKGIKIS
jgi:ribosomal RNA-processing protein 8